MLPSRRLSLHREELSELASDELSGVVGATGVTSVFRCQTYEVTCWGGCDRLTLPIDRCRIQTR